MSKRIRHRDSSSDFVDLEFATALEEQDTQRQQSHGRRVEHKTRQLCRQVQRALNLALAGGLPGASLETLFVSNVSPAFGCGHLIVHVVVPHGRSASDVLAELRLCAPRLRAEIARSISRKRAPELSFVPSAKEGDQHD